MNEMITIDTKSEKAFSIIMTRIVNLVVHKIPIGKELTCNHKNIEVKEHFKKYKLIVESIVKNAPKIESPQQNKTGLIKGSLPQEDKSGLLKKSLSIQQNGDFVKGKIEKNKIAGLEWAIDCLDPICQKVDFGSKIAFENEQFFKKINRIMDMKQTVMKADTALREFRGSQKLKIEKWAQRLLQPLDNLLISNKTLRKEAKLFEETQKKMISVLSSIIDGNVSNFEMNLKFLQPSIQDQLTKIQRELQISKRTNQNKTPNSNKLDKQAQTCTKDIVKKLQLSNQLNKELSEVINGILSQCNQDSGEVAQNAYNQPLQQLTNESSHLKIEDGLRNQPALKDLLMTEQFFKQEDIKIQKYRNASLERNKKAILTFLMNQTKLKAEIKLLKEQLIKEKQDKGREPIGSLEIKPTHDDQSNGVVEVKFKQEQLVNELALIKEQLKKVEDQKNVINSQIQQFQRIQKESKATILHSEQSIKQQNDIIDNLNKENYKNLAKIKELQMQLLNVQNAKLKKQEQQLIEQPQKIQYFHEQSWIYASEETKQIGEVLIKEIQKANNKQIASSSLLYRYSPSIKLEWAHFVNKPNIVFIIKIATNKFIGIYSLAPIFKPSTNSEATSEEKAFIFQANLNGTNIGVYPLLPGKKVNGSFSNNIAFGKSDLRFSISDTNLQGNFGYANSSFDSKKKKIADLLGCSGKVKMVAYQIYSVTFHQQLHKIKSHQKMMAIESKNKVKMENVIQRQKSSKSFGPSQINVQYERQVSELKQYISGQAEQIKLKGEQMADLKQKYQEIHKKQYIKNKECQFLKEKIKVYQIIKGGQEKEVTQTTEQTQNMKQINSSLVNLEMELETIKKTVLPEKEAAITVDKNDVGNLKAEIDKLQQSNKQLTDKLTQKEIQQKQVENNQEKLKSSPKNNVHGEELGYLSLRQILSNSRLNLTQSALISYQQCEQMAQIHQTEPLFIAHIDKFFDNNLLQGKLDYKIRIVKHLERMRGIHFWKAKQIFQYDPFGSNQYHKYIDGIPNMLCVIQTKEGMLLAGYYSGVYTQKQIMSKPSLLICINKDQSYELYKPGSNGQKIFRGMVYDPYFLLFGNAELKIKPKQKYIFSNFGIANSFFNPRGKKTKDFFGECPKINESEFKSMEIYQIFFEESNQQKILS